MNKDIVEVVLENTMGNAKYTSSDIQKELLNVIVNRIREEIGDAKFCILVNKAQDESKKEQMAIIMRFLDYDGFDRERFFEVVDVKETNASTLKKEKGNVLTRYNLLVEDLRG
ncbi:hypothetical protein CICLE_v10013852mg [Citrus x clementina]|uniref:DUF4371 domain-containing protein n=1 Tax=Citrus clementina TaxID=85681 RepID=V4USZ5_CITCL|nr:hypothetical protein CICLE_v10013852mg [Citrus x clementina]